MAPSKFEKHIKKRLQEREIRPSTDAWDRISGQLKASEKPKSKGYRWYGIAASIIGLLFVSVWYFNSEKLANAPQIVVKERPEHVVTQKKGTPEVVLEEGEIYDNANIEKTVEAKNTTKVVIHPEMKNPLKRAIVVVGKPDIRLEKVAVVPDVSNGLIDLKIAEIATEVDRLEKQNRIVTNEEIDSLLLIAQQEILESKIFRKDNSVDPMALLADVENELDRSFRDEIFDALKNGLIKVRTAVADRNK